MNDDELIATVKESVTNAHMTIPAERIISRSRAIRARRRTSGLTGALAVIAAAAVAVTGLPGHGTNSADALTVKLLADRAAAAALSRPAVRPGQWVYRKIIVNQQLRVGGPWVYLTGALWTTAAGRPGGGWLGRNELVVFNEPVIPYSKLSSLPSDPSALEKYLGSQPLHWPLWTGGPPVPGRRLTTRSEHATRAFYQISGMLWNYVLPPKLAAEAFHALADIPGIRVRRDATDVAKQHGVAFVLPHPEVPPGWPASESPAARMELILNPHDYALMALVNTVVVRGVNHGKPFTVQQVIVRQAYVSRPWVRP